VALPSGTVTFWFTDVEDSTRRWAEDEAGMRALIAQHDAIIDDVLAGHAGALVKHNGDGIDAVFRVGVRRGRALRRDPRRLTDHRSCFCTPARANDVRPDLIDRRA